MIRWHSVHPAAWEQIGDAVLALGGGGVLWPGVGATLHRSHRKTHIIFVCLRRMCARQTTTKKDIVECDGWRDVASHRNRFPLFFFLASAGRRASAPHAR